MKLLAVIYRVLLWLSPPDFRRRFGWQMAGDFEEICLEAGSRRSSRRWLPVARVLADAVQTAFREWRCRLAPRRRVAGGAGPADSAGGSPRGGRKRLMEGMLKDVRYGLRGLVRSPTFTFVAVITIAVGVGANSALYTMIRDVLVNPLPYPEAGRLVRISEASESGATMLVSYPNFTDWRDQTRSFKAVAAAQFPSTTTILGGSDAVRGRVVGVSRGYLETLGARPLAGRLIRDDENRAGGPPVILISERFWREQLGATPDLSGVSLQFYGRSWQVVGVLPDAFRDQFEDVDVWFPFEPGPSLRNAGNYYVVGRLADRASLASASAEMQALGRALADAYPETNEAKRIVVEPLQDVLVGDARAPLLLLAAAAGLLLLVACANMAAALLGRGAGRQHEVAVRVAMGAGRARVVRQLLTESLLLAFLGATVGVALAWGALNVVRRFAGTIFPRIDQIGVDASTIAFAGVLVVVTTLLFGLAPALRQTRSAMAVLRSGARNIGDGRNVLWSGLVAGEVALALLLVVGAGLMVRSVREIIRGDHGFDPSGVLVMDLSLPAANYNTAESITTFYDRLLSRLGALPGARAAGVVNQIPFHASSVRAAVIGEGGSFKRRDSWVTVAGWRIASPDYLAVMRIPLLRGRLFDERDGPGKPLVTVVNESFARAVWGDEDPIGKRVEHAWDTQTEGGGEFAEVIGVVADARDWKQPAGAQPEMFVSWRQRPQYLNPAYAVVRTGTAPEGLARVARTTVRDIDPDVPARVTSLTTLLGDTMADRRFTLQALGAFAAAALLLALVGIWGVVSHAVARRKREIGIRLALGAEQGGVVSMIQRSAMRTVAIGTVLGLVLAWVGTGLMRALLFDVSPTDPKTFLAATLLLVAAAAVASWVPARRASRVDPIRTLREE
ncbi:MAG: ABC transporter permease [Gemmatimonadota bacterium]|jgi:putative ABC transport system permease protein